MYKYVLIMAAAVLTVCGGRETQVKPAPAASVADMATTFTDTRDGKVYKTVKIGRQVWFAENLNYAAKGSVCYGEGGRVEVRYDSIARRLSNAEVRANCAKYGRLYTWEAAMKACPAGYHVPTFAEWDTLEKSVGGDEYKPDGFTAGTGEKLKSTGGWDDWKGKSGNGTDEYGFSALPGGYGGAGPYRVFYYAGTRGEWWSATETEGCVDDDPEHCDWGDAKIRIMDCYDGDLSWSIAPKVVFISLRCVRDKGGEQ